MTEDFDALWITTPDGATVDLAPLVEAARGVRRNAMIDREHEEETGASRIGVAYTLMGMKVAVKSLLGDEALSVFEQHLEGAF